MSIAEQSCYTLINVPTDAEPPTEIQLKIDLGENLFNYLCKCQCEVTKLYRLLKPYLYNLAHPP